jgi:hypothetical protein
MISLADYYMGRDVEYGHELDQVKRENAEQTVAKVNLLLEAFGEDRKVNSGFRPAAVNGATPGAAAKSKHMTCQACDLEDHDGDLDEWALDHPEILEQIGLWQEHPSATKNWAHFQIVPPKSGKRVFYP